MTDIEKLRIQLKPRTCPKCRKQYIGAPAISRVDNCTPICSDCGTREALEAMGCPEKEIEEILHAQHEVIHRGSN